jgi:hypothetical protein
MVTSLRIKPGSGLGNGVGATGMTALASSHVGGPVDVKVPNSSTNEVFMMTALQLGCGGEAGRLNDSRGDKGGLLCLPL